MQEHVLLLVLAVIKEGVGGWLSYTKQYLVLVNHLASGQYYRNILVSALNTFADTNYAHFSNN